MDMFQSLQADAGLLLTAAVGIVICGFALARSRRGGRRVNE